MLSRVGQVGVRALQRLRAGDAMLYVGGVSFYALLALFPGLTLVVTLYSIFTTPERAAAEAAALSGILPSAVQALVHAELQKIVHTSVRALSLQGVISLVIGVFAAHRGVKALLTGLQFVHGDVRQRTAFTLNVRAMLVALVSFVILTGASVGALTVRFLVVGLRIRALPRGLLLNPWTWAALALVVGLSWLYRHSIASRPVHWFVAIVAGVCASALTLAASWLCSIYVTKVVNLGATYGSFGAAIVFLIWLSWSVNGVLFGAAVAAELEQEFKFGDRRSGALNPEP